MAERAPSKTRVVTGKVRLSYCHVFEAWTNDPDKPAKFSTAILIPKGDTATLARLKAAEQAALDEQKGKVFGGRVPPNLKHLLHDGDEEADLERDPDYAGHMYMNVSSNTRPGIVDANVQPILDSTEVYSGCYARVALNAFCYNSNGSKGISFGLENIQKLADGEPLGGRRRAEDDFDAYDDGDDGDLI